MLLEFKKVYAATQVVNRDFVPEREAELGQKILNYGAGNTLFEAIGSFTMFFYNVSIVLIITFIAVSGVKYMTSAGDKGKTDEARKALLYSLGALALLLSIGLIVQYLIPGALIGVQYEGGVIRRSTIE